SDVQALPTIYHQLASNDNLYTNTKKPKYPLQDVNSIINQKSHKARPSHINKIQKPKKVAQTRQLAAHKPLPITGPIQQEIHEHVPNPVANTGIIAKPELRNIISNKLFISKEGH